MVCALDSKTQSLQGFLSNPDRPTGGYSEVVLRESKLSLPLFPVCGLKIPSVQFCQR